MCSYQASYSQTINRWRKTTIETAILETFKAVTLVVMDAETFCDRWYSLDTFSTEEREEAKRQRGYRAKCKRLLAAVLHKPETTVDSWGADFERMPDDCKITLSYIDAFRMQLKSAPKEIVDAFIESYKSI